MNVDQIPAVVQQLVREHVHSYEALEVLLLLHREPSRAWRLDEIAAGARLAADAVERELDQLTASQLVVASGAAGRLYRLQSERAEVAAAIDELAAAWRAHPVALIKLLNANALERLRTGAARALSDAFLFTKRGSDG